MERQRLDGDRSWVEVDQSLLKSLLKLKLWLDLLLLIGRPSQQQLLLIQLVLGIASTHRLKIQQFHDTTAISEIMQPEEEDKTKSQAVVGSVNIQFDTSKLITAKRPSVVDNYHEHILQLFKTNRETFKSNSHAETVLPFFALLCCHLANTHRTNFSWKFRHYWVKWLTSLMHKTPKQELHQLVGLGKTPCHSTLQSQQTFSQILTSVLLLVILRQKVTELCASMPANNCQPEVASEVIPGMAVQYVRMDVCQISWF